MIKCLFRQTPCVEEQYWVVPEIYSTLPLLFKYNSLQLFTYLILIILCDGYSKYFTSQIWSWEKSRICRRFTDIVTVQGKIRIPSNGLRWAHVKHHICNSHTNLDIPNKIFLKVWLFVPLYPTPLKRPLPGHLCLAMVPAVRVCMTIMQSTEGFFVPAVPVAKCSTLQYIAHVLTVPTAWRLHLRFSLHRAWVSLWN